MNRENQQTIVLQMIDKQTDEILKEFSSLVET
jgi:hypothetical protein